MHGHTLATELSSLPMTQGQNLKSVEHNKASIVSQKYVYYLSSQVSKHATNICMDICC